jgi:N-acetylmuramoyl-L-alanine amidase
MRRVAVLLVVVICALGVSRVEAGGRPLYEKATTLDEALRIADRLRAAGVDVTLTRADDRAVALSTRAAMSAGTDLLVSVHNNAALSRGVRGTEAYYQIGNQFGAEVAWSVVRAISSQVHTVARGAFTRKGDNGDYYAVLRESPTNSIIVEGAFLSNPTEARQLADGGFRARIADAIADALISRLVLTLVPQAAGPVSAGSPLLPTPVNLRAFPAAGHLVTLGWSGLPAFGYEVWRDGRSLGVVRGSAFADHDVPPGRHHYEVRTVLSAGERVLQASRSALIDTVVPWRVVIDAGHGGADPGAIGHP